MDLKNGIFHGKPVYILAIFLLIAALILSLCWAVTMGAANLSVKDVYGVILYKTLGIGDAELYGSGSLSDIVWFIRLPRLVLAICVGAALAVSGVVMQAIVKNPLADPYILGVSSGASIQGGETVIGRDSVIGSNVFITGSIPLHHRQRQKPGAADPPAGRLLPGTLLARLQGKPIKSFLRP